MAGPISSAPGLHSSDETLQRWQDVGDTVSDVTGPVIEPQTYRADSDILSRYANWTDHCNMTIKVILEAALKLFKYATNKPVCFSKFSATDLFETSRILHVFVKLISHSKYLVLWLFFLVAN